MTAAAEMTPLELDYALAHWQAVIRSAAVADDPWLFNFARSIARQARREAWRPSERQAQLMRRLVCELHLPDTGQPVEEED